jgi:hypothetical protein
MLRARGLSFREIGKQLGINHAVAWSDYINTADREDTVLTSELAKEQILAAHAELIGKLMADLDFQAANGQVEETRNGAGELVNSKVRRWISPQTAAEASRTLQRVAVLMGLTEVNPDQGNGSSGQTTNITLVSPAADGAAFSLRAEQLAEQALTVSATSAEPPAALDAPSTTHEPAEPPPAAPEETRSQHLQTRLERIRARRATGRQQAAG